MPASFMLLPPSAISLLPWIGQDTMSPTRAARRPLTLIRSEPVRIFPPWLVLSPSYASCFVSMNPSSFIFFETQFFFYICGIVPITFPD